MTQQHFVFTTLVDYLERRQQLRDDRRLARRLRGPEQPQPVTASVEPLTLPARPGLHTIAFPRLGPGGLAAPAHDSLG